eukprot:scaffold182645_cov50-Attheya_sp.AAC.1
MPTKLWKRTRVGCIVPVEWHTVGLWEQCQNAPTTKTKHVRRRLHGRWHFDFRLQAGRLVLFDSVTLACGRYRYAIVGDLTGTLGFYELAY